MLYRNATVQYENCTNHLFNSCRRQHKQHSYRHIMLHDFKIRCFRGVLFFFELFFFTARTKILLDNCCLAALLDLLPPVQTSNEIRDIRVGAASVS